MPGPGGLGPWLSGLSQARANYWGQPWASPCGHLLQARPGLGHSTCGVAEAQEDLRGDTGAGRVGNGFRLIPKPRLGTAGVRLIQAHPSVDHLPVTGQEGPPHMATPIKCLLGLRTCPSLLPSPGQPVPPPELTPQPLSGLLHSVSCSLGTPGQYFAPCILCWPLMVWGGVLPLGWAGGPTGCGPVPSPPLLP